jgi:hypothetical protein
MTKPLKPPPLDDVRTTGPGPALLLAATLVLGACAGGSLASVRTAPVPSLSDAVQCAREEGEEMDFRTARFDEEEHRLVLERDDRDVQQSDPKFQKAIDQLTFRPGTGADRPLEVTARTYYEYMTRRGRTRRQREASRGARAAADALLEACASGTTAARGAAR